MKYLIRKGRLIDPVSGIGGVMDILLEKDKVAVIGSDLSAPDAQIIEAGGLAVCAGLVDLHARLGQPGYEYRETVSSGSRAAAAGGYTTVGCLPDTQPPIDVPGGVTYLRELSAAAPGARVLPIAALSMGRQGAEVTDFEALKAAGAAALSDAAPLRNANLLRDAMILAHRQGLAVLAFCEDPDLSQNFVINEGQVSRRLRIPGRPAIAEELQVMREVMLAEETGTAVHICRVSTAKSVSILRRYKKKGVRLTCSACPPHFTFTEEEVLEQGPPARLEPPLRTPADVDGILEGLRDGTIDAIASDHTPYSEEETSLPLVHSPAGASALETTLAVSLTALYHSGLMSLSDVLRKLTFEPARILGLPGSGRLAVGGPADLVIFDPNEEWQVDPSAFLSQGRNTPYAGKTLKGKVKYTIVDGTIVYQAR
ncbi:MAG: dihydroorotase [Oscillospiraceae bacterium]|nr:dihydroorotase [Oscillospiraceae bacterium]